MRFTHLFGVLALSTALPTAVRAQASGPIPAVGQRVRIERTDAPRLTGKVVAFGVDTLVLQEQVNVPVTLVPMASVARYDVVVGRDRWRGARRGMSFGGVIGLALVGAAVVGDLNCDECFIPATVFAVPAGAILTLAGAGIGAVLAPERWAPIGTRGATTAPARGHVGLAISF